MSDFDDFEIPDGTDLGDVPDSGDPPPARYLFKIVKMEMKGRKSDASIKYISIQFKIVDVGDEKLEPYVGRSVFDIFNLGEAALWKVKELVTAVKGEATGKRIPNLTDELVVADTFEDKYEGRVNLRTKGYKSADGWLGINMDLTGGDMPPPADDNGQTKDKPADAGTVEI